MEGFPIDGIYMTWAQGLMYLRRRKGRDGAIVIRDVTLATLRYNVLRVRGAKDRTRDAEQELRRSLEVARKYRPKIGSPTPERRKRGVLAAVSLGLEKIPCIDLGGLSDIQKRAYVVADNRIAEPD